MKNVTTIRLNEFVAAFNIGGTKDVSPLSNLDPKYITNYDLHDLLRGKHLKFSKTKKVDSRFINDLGESLNHELTSTDRATIMMYFIQNTFVRSNNELDPVYEEMVYKAGQALSFDHEQVKGMIDFYLNDQPFTDNGGAAYFVGVNDKFSFRHIGMNIKLYEKKHVTYVKYIEKAGIFLSKTFLKELDKLSIADTHSIDNIRIFDTNNYNRADYGYYSFEELSELIEHFNPLGFYELQAKENMPKIVLDPELNKIIIAGNSSPLSPTNFFNPILEWVENFKKNGRSELKLYIMLNYFNTYTSKFLMRLAKECQTLSQSGCNTKIYWYCDVEDEDMTEFGENLQAIFKKGVELCFNHQEQVA
jgi:hypothetical protein